GQYVSTLVPRHPPRHPAQAGRSMEGTFRRFFLDGPDARIPPGGSGRPAWPPTLSWGEAARKHVPTKYFRTHNTWLTVVSCTPHAAGAACDPMIDMERRIEDSRAARIARASWIEPNHSRRGEAEAFIADRYHRAFGAALTRFFPHLL